MFVRTKQYGCLIITRHIVKVEHLRVGAFATLAVGDAVVLADEYHELALKLEHEATVPALPGWEALFFHCGKDEPASSGWLQREPVVAWHISEQTALAVTVDPDVAPQTLLRPNGTVTDPYNQDWDDLAAWHAWAREQHDAARKRPAAVT